MGIDPKAWLGWRHGAAAAALLAGAAPAAPPAGAAGPVPPTVLGLNLASPIWWTGERDFANLAAASLWQWDGGHGWTDPPAGTAAPSGALARIPADGAFKRILSPLHRPAGPQGIEIGCTFAGRAAVTAEGAVRDVRVRGDTLRFRITDTDPAMANRISVSDPSGAGHLDALDCRETDVPRDRLFAPTLLQRWAGFGVFRFKDWQHIDDNPTVTWATRKRPGDLSAATADGVAIEDMLALAAQAGVDPWLCVPWNADADYNRRFAQLVRERLPAGRHVYVEVANEVWNWGYPVTHQAMEEGRREGLTDDGAKAVLLRLAEKTRQTMGPWEQAFADRPGALVRVVAAQHVNSYAIKQLLAAPGLLPHVDAIATAPYFGLELKPAADDPTLDRFFRELDAAATATIDQAVAVKAMAHALGKRYIGYEAGQHLLVQDLGLATRIQRDDRMEAVYRRYLAAWQARVGDVLALFVSSSAVGGFGGFGLVEHDGQPRSETPKLRAVEAFLGR